MTSTKAQDILDMPIHQPKQVFDVTWLQNINNIYN